MARGYPKRIGRSLFRDHTPVIALVSAVVFALAFAVAWYRPHLIAALLIAPLATLLIDRKNRSRNLQSLLFQYAMIGLASVAVWLIK